MSTISLDDLNAMDRLDLIPREIRDWIGRGKENDALRSADMLLVRRKKRRLLRAVFGLPLFLSLGGLICGQLVLTGEPVPIIADNLFAWTVATLGFGTFFIAGCIAHPVEETLEFQTLPLREAYGLLRERMGVSFLDLRMMDASTRTERTIAVLIKLAEEVLRCEEHEKEMSRNKSVPGPQSRELATNDVQVSRARLHELHKAAQELGIVTDTNAKVYFDQAEVSLRTKEPAAA